MLTHQKLFSFQKVLSHHKSFFIFFLLAYVGLLISHVSQMGLGSWHMVLGLFAGLVAALWAHKSHGYAPSFFLVAHMGIEWYHHALHGNHYSNSELAFYGVHAIFDLMFLFVEARVHYGKYAHVLLVSALVIIGVMFWYFYVPAPTQSPFAMSPLLKQALELQKSMGGHVHNNSGGILHSVMIGGVIGCVISSFFLLLKGKHVHVH